MKKKLKRKMNKYFKFELKERGMEIMVKDRFIIQNNNSMYNILYLPDSFQIAKIKKGINIEEINISPRYLNEPAIKKLQLGEGKVGITFMSARTCNLKCRYCYAGEGEYGNVDNKPKTLSADGYMQAVNMVLKEYPEGIKSISFFGGEPLINFKEISIFVPEVLKEFDKRRLEYPKISMITNLVLLTDEMAAFLNKYNIMIAISLDGGKDINDLSRIGYTDESVYDLVMKGVERLKKHRVKFVLQATINRNHLKCYITGSAIEWAKSIEATGCSNFLAIPVESDIKDLTVVKDLPILDKFIRELIGYYLKKLVSDEPGIIPTGMVAPIFQIVHKKTVHNCTSGHSLLIDTDGKAYPCQMFCNIDEACIGSVKDGLQGKLVKYYANISRFKGEKCQNCIARNICVVWCKGIQLLSHGDMYEVCQARCVYQKVIMEECIKFLVGLDKKSREYANLYNNYKKLSERLMADGFVI
jgi:radical SAM protein with 4Fe4S-binding SPASM domain